MHTLRRRCPGEACTASRTACVLLGKGSHHCFGVVDLADMEERDGRTSLLFFFDYSIISGRFGAMEVFISCYFM
jgi:hypothetical protein